MGCISNNPFDLLFDQHREILAEIFGRYGKSPGGNMAFALMVLEPAFFDASYSHVMACPVLPDPY